MTDFVGQEVQVLTLSAPVGAIVDYGGDNAPADWMLCDGRALLRSAYGPLFAVLGTKFGSGDGSGTQFNLPDLRSRVTIGAAPVTPVPPLAPGLTRRAIGDKGGSEAEALTEAQIGSHAHMVSGATAGMDRAQTHNHTVQTRDYSFGESPAGGADFVALGAANQTQRSSGTDAENIDHLHAFSAASDYRGGNQTHNNMPPYVTINKVIKYQ